MSRWLHWLNNRKQDFCLLHTIQRTAMERLDSITRHLRKESNKSNKYEQSGKPSESVESTSTATTCARASSRTATRATSTGSTTSSRSSTTGSSKGRGSSGSTTANSLVRKHKYTTITTSRECANDILNREYAEYLASTSAGRKDVSTRVWASNEPRDFKQADADSGDSIERCIGIPAGVTV